MPTLPLPPITGDGVAIDGGDLPVSSIDDVTAVWATDLQQVQTAPVRDAFQQGELASTLAYQNATRYAAAQSDSLRATGEYEDEIFGFERGINRGASESDDAYRTRGNAFQELVDPADIVATVNALLAPFTTISCRYAERSDGMFLSNPNANGTTWSSHLFFDERSTMFGSADAGPNATPNYPDRLYSQIPARRPPGAMLNGDGGGRWFLLRVPDISGIDATVAAIYQQPSNPIATTRLGYVQPNVGFPTNVIVDDTSQFVLGEQVLIVGAGVYLVIAISSTQPIVTIQNTGVAGNTGPASNIAPYLMVVPVVAIDNPADGSGLFLGDPADGAGALNDSFLQAISEDSATLYQSIVDAVEAMRPHGVRWTLIVDPNLT